MVNTTTQQAVFADSHCHPDTNLVALDVPVPHPANRPETLHNIRLIQDIVARDLAARVDGDHEDLGIPAEPVIPLTDANTDLIVHVAVFRPSEEFGGAYAFTVHSQAGFYQSTGLHRHLTERELETQGLIETLDNLRDTLGRVSIYTASTWLNDYLNGLAELWRPYHRRHGKVVREEYVGWCHLLHGLFEHRQAGITSGYLWGNPALEYCERLARIYFESGATSIPTRSDVLNSLEND